MKWFVAAALAAGLAYHYHRTHQPLRIDELPPPATVQAVPETRPPLQRDLSAGPAFRVNGHELTALAEFSVGARVILARQYDSDREAQLSPVDLALAWGPMADPAVLAAIEFSQSGRFYRWRYEGTPPIPHRDIELHSANMHLIPASADLAKRMKAVRAGAATWCRPAAPTAGSGAVRSPARTPVRAPANLSSSRTSRSSSMRGMKNPETVMRLARPLAACAIALVASAVAAPAALAQGYPSKPVRLVVPFPPGGVTDIVGRLLAQKLGEALGQQVVVENRGGAAGAVGAVAVAKSAPDGYTLLMATATHAINATLLPNQGFDLVKDVAPVSLAASVPLLLAVHPSLPVKTPKELVAYAAANPGKANFASGSTGSASHLAGEMLKSMAKVDMVHVPYKGGSLGIQDLVAGQVQLMFENMPSILPFVQSGRLRGVAVTGPARSPAAPELPTMIESGFPDFEAGSWYGLFAPAGTPREILARLNTDMVKALRQPETKKLLAQQGAEAVGNSEAEFAAFIQAEIAKWGRVIRSANVKVE